ncbi:MAG: hypothetical protein IPG64_20105 [Haliea sp.]|nr:hypothetical protein [Haliea sp.]
MAAIILIPALTEKNTWRLRGDLNRRDFLQCAAIPITAGASATNSGFSLNEAQQAFWPVPNFNTTAVDYFTPRQRKIVALRRRSSSRAPTRPGAIDAACALPYRTDGGELAGTEESTIFTAGACRTLRPASPWVRSAFDRWTVRSSWKSWRRWKMPRRISHGTNSAT